MSKHPLVQHRDETDALDCPYGHVQRVVTAGAGGIANVHVVRITKGLSHVHQGYDEVYYLLSGRGQITLGEETYPLRPGSVAVIPAGVPHSLEADEGDELEFIIFGTPPISFDDPRAAPRKVE
jgi:mannose-6-phosphate isomerase-like protein (cupin superfamily)